MNLKSEQYAYLAGLIDGEGSLESQKQFQKKGKTPRYSLRLSIGMTTAEPLNTIANWLSLAPPKLYPSKDPKRQPRYSLCFSKGRAIELLRYCMPYLILKKRQAEIILAIETTREKYSPPRRHFGHPHAIQFPLEGLEIMNKLHIELRSLKSNKRKK